MCNSEHERDVRKKIKDFILRSVNLTDISEEDNLFESGIVNSLFAVQLMTFLEKTFQIEVGMEDLEIENFKSVRAAAEFILRKSAAATT